MTTVAVVCEKEASGRALAGLIEPMSGTTVRAVLTPGPAVSSLLLETLDVLVTDEASARWSRAALLASRRPARVVVVAATAAHAADALVAGADAVVLAPTAPQTLALAVASVAAGLCAAPRAAIDALLVDRGEVLDLDGAERLTRLTPREREVLTHLMRGELQPQVAASLHLSVHTVRFHVKQILMKLRVHSTLEAAMLAARSGMAMGAGRAGVA